METKHLSYFKIENFKRFDSLEVKDIGQFNLIVGDNNVGKTTLLEALLFDDGNYDNCLINLDNALENREVYIDDYVVNYMDFYFGSKVNPLIYTYQIHGDNQLNVFSIKKKNKNNLTEPEIQQILVGLQLYKSPYIVEFDRNNVKKIKIVRIEAERKDIISHFPFLGVKNFYDEDTFDFDLSISTSNKKLENLKEQLRYFIPNLTAIETKGADPINTIILRESNIDAPIPLAMYGDGTVKLFRCLLKMEFCHNRRLMIDEFDSGIHYSRMKEFLKRVLQTAKDKNVQIFATTHSKECLQYYKEALQELGYENDGRIIKLANTKSGIKSYTYNFEQFENALLAEGEIR